MKYMLTFLFLFLFLTITTAHAREPVKLNYDCPPGMLVETHGSDGSHDLFLCPEKPETIFVPGPPIEGTNNFEWALAAAGFYMNVNGGPSGGGIEALFEGRLKISEEVKFIFSAGPLVAFLSDHGAAPGLTEFVGIEWSPGSSWFHLAFGGRHRAIFDGSGDLTNGVGLEARLRLDLGNSFSFRFGGNVGGAWFPSEEEQPGLWPGGTTPPTITTRGDGFAWSTGSALALEY